MSRLIRVSVLSVVLLAALFTGRARAQGGNCYAFGEWIMQQGGQVYFIEPSFTAGFCIIGFYIYGQGGSSTCQCG